ncbi:MAG: hypothetical protein BWY70_00304 [Bacteroidetes bacterium ADurb.Bin408]|nr:MAG: hypothetical protein BWY70_00304 [Bacteroidetes bacterium ADurb.Bin408]
MHKLISIFLIILIIQSISLHAQSYTYRESFKVGNMVSGGIGICATADTGNVLSILIADSMFAPLKINMTRVDKMGNLKWSKDYGEADDVLAYNPIELTDHNILISGRTGSGTGNVLIFKTDSNGNKLWAKSFSTGMQGFSQVCLEGNPNSYFICCASGNDINEHFLLLNIDSTGSLIYAKRFGSDSFDDPISFSKTHDGGIVFIGRTMGFGVESEDFYLVKLDSLGNVLWSKTFGGIYQECGRKVVEANDKSLLLVGETNSFNSPNSGLVIKTDSMGNFLWSKTYYTGNFVEFDDCLKMPDGNFVITNSSSGLLKIDNSGDVLWSYNYLNYFGGFSCLNINNDIALAGLTWHPDSLTICKTDINGYSCEQTPITYTVNNVILSIKTPLTILYPVAPVITDYILPVVNNYPQRQIYCQYTNVIESTEKSEELIAYPNPATNNLTVQTPENYIIEIISVKGQIIKKLINNNNETTIDLSDLSPGVYIIKAHSDKGFLIHKFIKQ